MPKHCITPAARRAGVEACQARAAERAAKLAPIIDELKAAGITTLSGIAAAFNARGVLTHGSPLLVLVTDCATAEAPARAERLAAFA
jgi:hypothetical protein